MTALSRQSMPLAEAHRRAEWLIETHSSILPPFQSSTAFGYTPRYLFSTKEYLPDAKLYLYQYRVYDPIAGRWTQRDPIDYQDSINLYQFCGNNPVNAVDPSGLIAPLVAILIIVGFVATIDAGCRIAVNVRGGPYALTFPGLAPRTGKNLMKRTRVVQHVIREHERMHEGGASEREASIDSYWRSAEALWTETYEGRKLSNEELADFNLHLSETEAMLKKSGMTEEEFTSYKKNVEAYFKKKHGEAKRPI